MKQHDHQDLIAFRLPAELARELRKLAKDNDRPVSGELRLAVKAHLGKAA